MSQESFKVLSELTRAVEHVLKKKYTLLKIHSTESLLICLWYVIAKSYYTNQLIFNNMLINTFYLEIYHKFLIPIGVYNYRVKLSKYYNFI